MKNTLNKNCFAVILALGLSIGAAQAAVILTGITSVSDTGGYFGGPPYFVSKDSTEETGFTLFLAENNDTLDSTTVVAQIPMSLRTGATDFIVRDLGTATGYPVDFDAVLVLWGASSGSTIGTFSNPSNLDTLVTDSISFAAGESRLFAVGLSALSTSGAVNTPSFATVVVPEPSSTALIGVGGLALILRRRR